MLLKELSSFQLPSVYSATKPQMFHYLLEGVLALGSVPGNLQAESGARESDPNTTSAISTWSILQPHGPSGPDVRDRPKALANFHEASKRKISFSSDQVRTQSPTRVSQSAMVPQLRVVVFPSVASSWAHRCWMRSDPPPSASFRTTCAIRALHSVLRGWAPILAMAVTHPEHSGVSPEPRRSLSVEPWSEPSHICRGMLHQPCQHIVVLCSLTSQPHFCCMSQRTGLRLQLFHGVGSGLYLLVLEPPPMAHLQWQLQILLHAHVQAALALRHCTRAASFSRSSTFQCLSTCAVKEVVQVVAPPEQ